MKVAFVRPNYPTYFSTPPLGLGYLSASVKAVGIESSNPEVLKAIKKGEKNYIKSHKICQ